MADPLHLVMSISSLIDTTFVAMVAYPTVQPTGIDRPFLLTGKIDENSTWAPNYLRTCVVSSDLFKVKCDSNIRVYMKESLGEVV